MPFHKRIYENGSLFVVFKVKFPESVDAKQAELINKALGQAKKEDQKADETVVMKDYNEHHRNTHHAGGN